MGPDPVGFLSYQADGRVMALVVRRWRPIPKGPRLTENEKVALFDVMLAYSDSYTVTAGLPITLTQAGIRLRTIQLDPAFFDQWRQVGDHAAPGIL
ncbi:hypothetical protein ABIE78_002891 [Sinorhizobium fredii]